MDQYIWGANQRHAFGGLRKFAVQKIREKARTYLQGEVARSDICRMNGGRKA